MKTDTELFLSERDVGLRCPTGSLLNYVNPDTGEKTLGTVLEQNGMKLLMFDVRSRVPHEIYANKSVLPISPKSRFVNTEKSTYYLQRSSNRNYAIGFYNRNTSITSLSNQRHTLSFSYGGSQYLFNREASAKCLFEEYPSFKEVVETLKKDKDVSGLAFDRSLALTKGRHLYMKSYLIGTLSKDYKSIFLSKNIPPILCKQLEALVGEDTKVVFVQNHSEGILAQDMSGYDEANDL